MNNKPHTPLLPNVDHLIQDIVRTLPFHAQALKQSLADLKTHELQQLEEYLSFCLNQGLSITYLVDCYKTIVNDTLRESIYFQEHKKYRHTSFAEVADSVYNNKQYMSLYMHGVLMTLFLWPNHRGLYRFFRATLPKNHKGTYLEIGPGHGYFFKTATQLTDYDDFIGIDLSDTSIEQTRILVSQYTEKKIQLHCVDFMHYPLPESSYDAIVMGEVLEHVENPKALLKKIVLLAKKNAYIFVTTCINAPITDHIYQFDSVEQLQELFSQCNLSIKEQCILPYLNKTLDECKEQGLAINVGYVLEKK